LLKKTLQGEGTGHDFFHVERVAKLALKIAEKEKKGDKFLIEIASLLHDIADWKFHDDETLGAKKSRIFLVSQGVDNQIIDEVEFIVNNISFKGGINKIKMRSIEGQIVQDADRLEALGAIGIGRAFAYGGFKEREMYNPDIKLKKYKSLKSYKNAKSTTINHFYEKLLLLPKFMNTKTGKKIANDRKLFMEKFLDEFYKEWEVKI